MEEKQTKKLVKVYMSEKEYKNVKNAATFKRKSMSKYIRDILKTNAVYDSWYGERIQ